MRTPKWLFLFLFAGLVALGVTGCASDAKDTTGFAVSDSASVAIPFDQAWQVAKGVLREKQFDIYTRDKRGVFVAYSGSKRHRMVTNSRMQYTVALEREGDASTKITVETVKQVYGVTLLTYPGWHDRKATDHAEGLAILEAIKTKAAEAPAAAK